MSEGAFSIGFRYDYWSKYKDEHESIMNEMYVDKKYDNFQAEILQYQHEMDMKTYKNELLVKVNEYLQSEAVKSTKCPVSWYWTGKNTGEASIAMTKDTTILKDQLISIILYTDYTKLSRNFSSTFRKQHPFDSLATAKRRNQKYWWWSKNLIETVQVFGGYYANETLIGPFYTGMGTVLKIPEFQIRLFSPTSTTTHIEVAMKFSGQQGIIIEMNNDKVGNEIKAMDVSWLSRFAEEEER